MSKTTNTISVQRRGTFAEDNFFKDSWDEWDRAMNDAVSRWNEHTGTTRTKTTLQPAETKSVYRQIRSSNVTSDESQAVSCTEEEDKYKMVMDVKDFNPEDINVKVVDDTIVVEGKIEKKEGNAITTQKFTRRFLLPSGINMGAIASALSKDGVLTINAPKLAITSSSGTKTVPIGRSGDHTITSQIMGSNPRSSYTYVNNPPAGKPSAQDYGPFNPTGGRGDIRVQSSTPGNRFTETVVMNVPDRRGSGADGTKWTSFNTMVEKSQREMDDMMRRHTLTPDTVIEPQPLAKPLATSAVVMSPAVNAAGVNVKRDVVESGNTTTHRQMQKWDDAPAPGMNRKNRDYEEKSEIRGDDGNVIGNKMRSEKESHAQGEREEVLPDGTKCKIFTKSYETKNKYSASTNNAKAL